MADVWVRGEPKKLHKVAGSNSKNMQNIRIDVRIERANIPNLLYDPKSVGGLGAVARSLTHDANSLAYLNAQASLPLIGQGVVANRSVTTDKKKPYRCFVVHGDHTPIYILETNTKAGAEDNAVYKTLQAVIDNNSHGWFSTDETSIEEGAKKYVKQLNTKRRRKLAKERKKFVNRRKKNWTITTTKSGKWSYYTGNGRKRISKEPTYKV